MANAAFRSAASGGDSSFTTTTISATVPAGTVQDDGGLIFYSSAAAAPTAAPTHTDPAGWTALGTTVANGLAGGVLNVRLTVYYRTEPASPAAVTLTSSINAAHAWTRASYDNVLTSGWGGQVVFSTFTGTSAVATGLTTTKDNALIGVYVAQGAAQAFTPDGTLTERNDNAAQGLEWADAIQATAGATGTRTGTAPASTDGVMAFVEAWSELPSPVIVHDPSAQSVAVGATATFTIEATGATSYQWQDDRTGSFTNVASGGTSASYTTPATDQTYVGRSYRCVATNSAGSTTSAQASLGVLGFPAILWSTSIPSGNDAWLRDPQAVETNAGLGAGSITGSAVFSGSGASFADANGTQLNATTFTASGVAIVSASGSIGGTATFTANGIGVASSNGTISGLGAFTANGNAIASVAASIAGQATFSAIGAGIASAAGLVAEVATFAADSAAGSATASGDAVLNASATFSGAGATISAAAGSMTGVAEFAAESTVGAVTAGNGSISVAAIFGASGASIASGFANSASVLSMSGASATIVAASGSITASANFDGASVNSSARVTRHEGRRKKPVQDDEDILMILSLAMPVIA